MKRLVLTGIATVALALGAGAQGIIGVDDLNTQYGVAINTAGNYYSGTYGLELWELNAAAVPSGINGAANTAAYAALSADGFKLENTWSGQTMAAGAFSLNPAYTMADATPGGASVTVALAVWNSAASSFSAATASGTASGGVIAFVTPTEGVPSSGPALPGPSLSSVWTSGDLVMSSLTSVPEPGTLALAGLGMAALLIFRRRK